MSDEPGPIPFTDDCPTDHVPVDNQDAAAMQRQMIAYDGLLVHRPSADNGGDVPVHGQSTCVSMTDVGGRSVVEPLQETNWSKRRRRSASIDHEDKVLKPLSFPDVAHDSESASKPEVRPLNNATGHLAELTGENRVLKRSRSGTARPAAGHVSQACDSSDQLPISSSENAEEQGKDKVRNGRREPPKNIYKEVAGD